MKLIITGATGYLGGELVRQSLRSPHISSVIALARQPVPVEDTAHAAKLKSVIIKDYAVYPDDVKKELAGADACIWTVAITPSKSKAYQFSEVKRVCQESTILGLKAMQEAEPGKPFRFLYVSGVAAERDQTKKPMLMGEYSLMRGETENQVLAIAAASGGAVEASVAKPGLITSENHGLLRKAQTLLMKVTIAVPTVDVQVMAAAMLDQVVNGFEKDPLMNEDLERIGQAALSKQV
ncbi:hypothetical protein BX600DRAFT_451685 [Xylariales sp. PMI_506]|nr:hypothetical protein BX600DRAFT_451685 [Xylariales sp. PMI_506]